MFLQNDVNERAAKCGYHILQRAFCNGRLCRRIQTCRMRPASLIGSSAVSADRSASVFWIGSFLPLPCAAEAKIPSRATQKVAAGAASASRRCPAAHKDAGYETDQKPCFGALFSLRLYRQVESLRCANARRRLGATGRTRTADLLITNSKTRLSRPFTKCQKA